MFPSLGRKPPFEVPEELGAIEEESLKRISLYKLYEENQQDFFDLVAILYFEIMSIPDRGALGNEEEGFAAFCEIITQALLAAPSQRMGFTKDEQGRNVNFFGKAIVGHLPLKFSLQDLYGPDLYGPEGPNKQSVVWRLVNTFVRFVVIRSFWGGLLLLQETDIAAARTRIQQLLTGTRALRFPSKPIFH